MYTQKKKMFYSIFSKLLVISGSAAIALYAYSLLRDFYMLGQSRNYYESLSVEAENFIGREVPVSEIISEGPPPVEINGEETPLSVLPEIITEPLADGPIIPEQEYGGAKEEQTSNIDFLALSKAGSGIVAWIRCENTPIDYPIVQGHDNEYYLNRLPDGTKNKMGSIFLDYRNSANFSDDNSLIYGHHMESGDMFGALENYKQQKFYNEHPNIMLYMPNGEFVIELFAGYIVDAAQETLPRSFTGPDGSERYIAQIRKRSFFTSNVEVNTDDKLITLCTCTYDFNDARFILVGKLTGSVS